MKALAIALLVAFATPAYAGKDVRYAIVIGNNAPPASGTTEKLRLGAHRGHQALASASSAPAPGQR
jgi:hypothetical protein